MSTSSVPSTVQIMDRRYDAADNKPKKTIGGSVLRPENQGATKLNIVSRNAFKRPRKTVKSDSSLQKYMNKILL